MSPDRCRLYLGTEDGLRVVSVRTRSDIEIIRTGLHGEAVRALAVHPTNPERVYIGCGLRGSGCHYTRDGGRSIDSIGFEDKWVWDVTLAPTDPDRVYVGTEPPMLYVSPRTSHTFEAFEGIAELPSRPDWTFYHEPFGDGHVHGLSIHPDRPDRLVAGVEDGALIYSRDHGESWSETLVGHDIHRVATAPSDPDTLLAGAEEGLFVSHDAGETWEKDPTLAGNYVHGIRFDTDDPSRIYLYVSEEMPLYRSDDGGDSWRAIGDALPTAGPADNLRVHPTEPNVLFYAGDGGDGGSQLFISTDRGDSWQRVLTELPKVWRVESATTN
ncbi:MAG: hypothetical protein ABEJ35_02555 [Halobacteriaceae archaeon]